MNTQRGMSAWMMTACVGATMSLGVVRTSLAQPVSGPEREVKEAGLPAQPEPPSMKDDKPAPAADDSPGIPDDGPAFEISQFVLEYARQHPDLPDLSAKGFEDLKVTWGVNAEGAFVSPYLDKPGLIRRPDVARFETLTLREFRERGGGKVHRSGIKQVAVEIVGEFYRQNIFGLFAVPSPEDISAETDEDLREGRTAMRMSIFVASASNIRTIAGGERISGEKINHPAHAKIRMNSPVKQDNLIRRDRLDKYVYRLNRHPGRRVDVAVSSAGDADDPGKVYLDYLVSENRPWTAYFQLSNTGTESTDKWRERFGFAHNQLTGNDDILRLDYITAGFDESHAVVGSYEFPITDRFTLRGYGSWSKFDASELGASGTERFKGESWSAGLEGVFNAFQFDKVFIDLFAGVKWQHVKILNETAALPGAVENFFLPYFGARLERNTDASSSLVQVSYEFNLPDVAGTDEAVVQDSLGRLGADDEWQAIQWDASTQFYLEPLFNPKNPKHMTLAHELAFSVRGQYAFDNRLIPYFQQTAGGLYSVRGYPESAAAGDSVVIASAEYRLHLPRIFGTTEQPGSLFGREFRWRPAGPYGRPDWDLILKAFVDAGRTENSDIQKAFESDETLVGAGLGVELQISRNFNMRADWGVALEEIDGRSESGAFLDDAITAGSQQWHLSFTVLY